MPIVTTAQKDFQSKQEMLKQIPIFGGISELELKMIYDNLIQVQYQAGEMIFQQGSLPSDIYIVSQGEVCIKLEGEQELELIKFTAGDCFGETSVIGILPHTATATALSETTLLALSGETLGQLHQHHPSLFGHIILNIAREACRRLSKTDEMLSQYINKNES